MGSGIETRVGPERFSEHKSKVACPQADLKSRDHEGGHCCRLCALGTSPPLPETAQSLAPSRVRLRTPAPQASAWTLSVDSVTPFLNLLCKDPLVLSHFNFPTALALLRMHAVLVWFRQGTEAGSGRG